MTKFHKRKAGTGKTRKQKLIRRLRDRDGDLCWICKLIMSFDLKDSARMQYVSLDHVKPRSDGGDNSIGNLKLAHVRCNTARGNGVYGSNIPLRVDGEYQCLVCGQWFVMIVHRCPKIVSQGPEKKPVCLEIIAGGDNVAEFLADYIGESSID